MEYVIICLVAFLGSGLTLFSGFGLGTILVPVFGLFFPIELSIALTAIVHFLNNLFKLSLFGKQANRSIVLRFGIPSILAAFAGAYVLSLIGKMNPLITYSLFDKTMYVMPVKLIIAVLLALFALMDLIPKFSKLEFDVKYLSVGGVLSGFFGGLSGNQGALRTAFLIKAGLSKEAFIATGVVIACLVDISRLTLYSGQLEKAKHDINYWLIIFSTMSAFLGAYIGNKVLKKTTINSVKYLVAAFLLLFSMLLALGVL